MIPSTILVTGGAGFIGSHTAKALAEAGYWPVVYDKLVTGHTDAVRWGPLEVGDIADRERLAAVIDRYSPEAVIHFAAFAYVGESNVKPLGYYLNNVRGSLTLLETMQASGLTKLVFSSSCATYGNATVVPIIEETPQEPINAYGHSKLMIERVLRDTAAIGAIDAVALRYFNAAGASSDGKLGERHDPETHLIPLALMAALDETRTLQVFGTDYETPDGTCVRDFVHVEDLADAHVAAVEGLLTGRLAGFNGINLGTGTGYSVRQVIAETQRLTNRRISIVDAPRRPGDPSHLVADSRKARELLGWTARRSDLPTMIRSAFNFFSKA